MHPINTRFTLAGTPMIKSTIRCLLLVTLAVGCSDSSAPSLTMEVSLAKGGGSPTQKVEYTISGTDMSLVGDGKGAYRNGTCGVIGTWDEILYLSPTGANIPRAQKADCSGIAPRSATLTLAVRHISDNPHVDDASQPPSSYAVQNVKFGFGAAQATTINAPPSCGQVGLRFTAVTYPGSDHVVREDVGGGLWRMYTRPWPDNRAYCENGGVVTFWHVSFDLYVQIIG